MSADPRESAVALDVVVVSHRGRVRSSNEDALALGGWVLASLESEPLAVTLRPGVDGLIIAIADGMGGHRGGADASRTALTALAAVGGDPRRAVSTAAEALRSRSATEPNLEGMGTTVVGVRVLEDGSSTFFNVGDSRAYRLVDGYLGQVSVDDRPAQEGPSNRGVVTQHLGGDRVITLDLHLHDARLVPGDRVLLCSDGLHDMIGDDHIAECLRLSGLHAVSALLAAALDAGGEDNVSIVVIDVRTGDGGACD